MNAWTKAVGHHIHKQEAGGPWPKVALHQHARKENGLNVNAHKHWPHGRDSEDATTNISKQDFRT